MLLHQVKNSFVSVGGFSLTNSILLRLMLGSRGLVTAVSHALGLSLHSGNSALIFQLLAVIIDTNSTATVMGARLGGQGDSL